MTLDECRALATTLRSESADPWLAETGPRCARAADAIDALCSALVAANAYKNRQHEDCPPPYADDFGCLVPGGKTCADCWAEWFLSATVAKIS